MSESILRREHQQQACRQRRWLHQLSVLADKQAHLSTCAVLAAWRLVVCLAWRAEARAEAQATHGCCKIEHLRQLCRSSGLRLGGVRDASVSCHHFSAWRAIAAKAATLQQSRREVSQSRDSATRHLANVRSWQDAALRANMFTVWQSSTGTALYRRRLAGCIANQQMIVVLASAFGDWRRALMQEAARAVAEESRSSWVARVSFREQSAFALAAVFAWQRAVAQVAVAEFHFARFAWSVAMTRTKASESGSTATLGNITRTVRDGGRQLEGHVLGPRGASPSGIATEDVVEYMTQLVRDLQRENGELHAMLLEQPLRVAQRIRESTRDVKPAAIPMHSPGSTGFGSEAASSRGSSRGVQKTRGSCALADAIASRRSGSTVFGIAARSQTNTLTVHPWSPPS